MTYAELDVWDYIFFTFETILNVLFVPIVCFLFYICITQKNLHVNFRSTLFVTGVGYLICAIHRLVLVPTRLCCIARRMTPFVNQIMVAQFTGGYIAVFGWLFVAVERATATVFTNKYEANCTGWLMPTVLCGAVLSAYQRTFFGLALTLRSQKLDHIMKREKKTVKVTANEAPAASNYHKELRAMWS
ncbi:hypothetical protein RB195_020823 [Necator americanus]|uniref:G-protein coupled receptors family 1 profile domain-containing protein n=1 Tax=Necator americanus TaxID=51031 RepID=A0ABR1CMU1_NECAM